MLSTRRAQMEKSTHKSIKPSRIRTVRCRACRLDGPRSAGQPPCPAPGPGSWKALGHWGAPRAGPGARTAPSLHTTPDPPAHSSVPHQPSMPLVIPSPAPECSWLLVPSMHGSGPCYPSIVSGQMDSPHSHHPASTWASILKESAGGGLLCHDGTLSNDKGDRNPTWFFSRARSVKHGIKHSSRWDLAMLSQGLPSITLPCSWKVCRAAAGDWQGSLTTKLDSTARPAPSAASVCTACTCPPAGCRRRQT